MVIAEKTENSVTSQPPHKMKQARSGSPRGSRRRLAMPQTATTNAAGISQPVSRPRPPRSRRYGTAGTVGSAPLPVLVDDPGEGANSILVGPGSGPAGAGPETGVAPAGAGPETGVAPAGASVAPTGTCTVVG